jgi:hypothetical protein
MVFAHIKRVKVVLVTQLLARPIHAVLLPFKSTFKSTFKKGGAKVFNNLRNVNKNIKNLLLKKVEQN